MSKIDYKKKIVAFIDILGFKSIIEKSEKDKSKIEMIYSALKYFKDWEIPDKWDLKLIEIEEDAQKNGVQNFDIAKKTKCTTFSDLILISVDVEDNVNEMASTLIANIAFMGACLLEQDILIRGGMTIGNLYHDDSGTVFGSALIEAYQLENNLSIYPRVLLSDKLIKELNYPLKAKRDRYPYHQYVYRFHDGCAGFHQLQYYQVIQSSFLEDSESLKGKLDKVRNVIISGLDHSFENPDIYKKYRWLADQYNELIVFDEVDFNDRSKDKVIKHRLYDLNENIVGNNVHYSYTEEAHKRSREKKI